MTREQAPAKEVDFPKRHYSSLRELNPEKPTTFVSTIFFDGKSYFSIQEMKKQTIIQCNTYFCYLQNLLYCTFIVDHIVTLA